MMAQGMRRRLSDEVSVSEMLELRRRGYKNSEIAEQLEVTPQTILRYIGRNDGKTSNAYRYNYVAATVDESAKSPVLSPDDYAACKAHIEAKKAEAEPKPAEKPTADDKGRLKVTNMVLDFSGAAGFYRADQEKREVTLGITTYTYDKLADLIADLTALKEAVHA